MNRKEEPSLKTTRSLLFIAAGAGLAPLLIVMAAGMGNGMEANGKPVLVFTALMGAFAGQGVYVLNFSLSSRSWGWPLRLFVSLVFYAVLTAGGFMLARHSFL